MSATGDDREKMVKIVRCPFCGAGYEKGLLRCPYCGSVDDHQDESEFLEDLDELKDKLEDLPEDTIRQEKENQTREAVRDFRSILKRVGIVAGVFVLLFAAGMFFDRVIAGNSGSRYKEKSQERYLWMQENFPVLDEMYEKGDYEGLLEFYEGDDSGWLYEWEHYDLMTGLYLIRQFKERDLVFLAQSEEQYGVDSKQALNDRAVLLSRELQLLYFDRQASNKEDIETIWSLSGEAREDLETRFALTEEEQEYFRKLVNQNAGYISIRDCREFLEKQ